MSPVESLFYFSGKYASFRKGNGKKQAPLCLADFFFFFNGAGDGTQVLARGFTRQAVEPLS